MLRARGKRVLVRCKELEDEIENGYSTESSIASGRKIITGIVITAGEKVQDLTTGDRIYFPKYSANEFNYGKELLFSLDSDDIEYVEVPDE